MKELLRAIDSARTKTKLKNEFQYVMLKSMIPKEISDEERDKLILMIRKKIKY